ncbi:hypothetical protein [Rhodopseudomonas palustris]|uniref:hypothetical protein n=1 Tax=Rhodopseudomonas palustris TaxID=1076 RepID=UPI000D210D2C|nr:hypothetical protein [Rhodopseudomonas palustris]AVT82913.1 hypothetical protein RPYSC3_40530 [Rhodopseudomonas palustris]
MSSVTRRALRVYAALNELHPGQQDVLDALLPFFEPILEKMNGRFFDPRLLALGVRKLYRWRFTTDIADILTPRLLRAGYLKEITRRGADVAYLVQFESKNGVDDGIDRIIKDIIDDFESFSPRLSDLLHYKRSREELTDILIRFLVSLDAYNPATFSAEVARLKLDTEDTRILAELEEGGEPLPNDDRYMAARFVQHICEKRIDAVPILARLASIGLLTEVVEDFVRPINLEQNVSLTVAVDAPLALDFLGCSGTILKEDVRIIFDSLKKIGCALVVYPITCDEIRKNLLAMLALPEPIRHGYTHQAILKREVTLAYVQAVASDPQRALERAGITVLPIDLKQRPDTHRYFTDEQYEDFFSSITWVRDVAPREHDATSLALTMRLRTGRHNSDIFRTGYIFVTRNPAFVRNSRKYCLENRLLYETQENAVIHQRELATVAWLRTGLGAERIPRGQLLAACDRVLQVRNEVRDAVAVRLRDFTPEKAEEFEILIGDHRSLRRLADQTLNNENVVTPDNAEALLEAMRQATIAEEKKVFEERLAEEQDRHKRIHEARAAENNQLRADAAALASERDAALQAARAVRASREESIRSVATWTSSTIKTIDLIGTSAIIVIAACAILNYFTGWLAPFRIWSAGVGGLLGAFALFHGVMNALERPKPGLASALNWLSRKLLARRLSNAQLAEFVNLDKVEIKNGRIKISESAFK